ncbi:MAG: hypothetical protein B7Z26_05820 [Asticcacaulis sp. 32-58-5]|nr:MAG: hypothetical protein B7Z26_05820 [Asticcacaulis sp. 32-58-5]
MRLGWDDASRNAAVLAKRAEDIGVKAITVHGRTRQQFYKGAADWQAVRAARDAVDIPVIVNGDVTDFASAREALIQSGASAIMIGRGVYGRPWLASWLNDALISGTPDAQPAPQHRLDVILEHFQSSLEFYGSSLGLRMFKKHLGWYLEAGDYNADPAIRRQDKARICRLDIAADIELELKRLMSA